MSDNNGCLIALGVFGFCIIILLCSLIDGNIKAGFFILGCLVVIAIIVWLMGIFFGNKSQS